MFRLLQEALAVVDRNPDLRTYNLTAEVTKDTLLLTFDAGEISAAEPFAAVLAASIGWKTGHGMLIGSDK